MRRLASAVAVLLVLGASGCAVGPLVTAAREGDTAKVDALIAQGADVNKPDGGSDPCTTPLMAAAEHGQDEVVRGLLKRGADIDASSPGGTFSALYCAANGQHENTVRLLLASGASVRPELVADLRHGLRPFGDEVGRRIIAEIEEAAARPRSRPTAVAVLPAPPAVPAAPVAASPAPASMISSDADLPTERLPVRPDDFALVVGIEDYSRLPGARYAARDADAVKAHLLALGYPERNIILLKDGQATNGALRGYIEEWLPKNAKPDSQVFVYFSGHGSPDPKSGDAYLVPWDGDAMFLKSTAFPLKTLYADLGRLKAKRVLVALDSCFSGAGGRSVLASGARPLVSHLADAAAPSGLTVLSAASGDEITATVDAQGHGAFTYYLLKALNDGKLTAKAAYDELKPRVEDEAHRQNREQTPLLLGEDAPF